MTCGYAGICFSIYLKYTSSVVDCTYTLISIVLARFWQVHYAFSLDVDSLDSLLVGHHISLLQSISLSSSFWRFAGSPRSPSERSEPVFFRFFSLFPSLSCHFSWCMEKRRHPSNPAKSLDAWHLAESCASNGCNFIQTRYFMFSPGFLLVFLVLLVLMTEYVPHSHQNIYRVYGVYQQTYSFVHRIDARPHPLPWAPRASHMWAASCKEGKSPMRMGQKPRLPLATADGLSDMLMLQMGRKIWGRHKKYLANKELNMHMHYHAMTIVYLIVVLCWCAFGSQMLQGLSESQCTWRPK